jgi:hypothetical protein
MLPLFNKTAASNDSPTSSPGLSASTSYGHSGESPLSASHLGEGHDVLFSFAAAGWLQMFHFGAAKALQDSGLASMENLTNPNAATGKVRFAGSSAGSLASAALVVGTDMDALREYACACAIDCRSKLFGAFGIKQYIKRGVDLFATGVFKEATAKARERRRNAVEERQQLNRQARRRSRAEVIARRKFRENPEDDGAAVTDAITAPADELPEEADSTPETDDADAVARDSGYDSDNNRTHSDMFDDDEFTVDDGTGGTLDLAALLQERLEVYATTLPFLGVKKFHEFADVEDLEEALTASCLMVPLAGMPFRVRRTGEFVMDGALVAIQPRAGEKGVVTISTIYFASADVKPSCFIPLWWILYPPSDEKYRALFVLGYNDCVDGLLRKRLISPAEFSRLRSRYPGDAASRVVQRGPFKFVKDAFAFFFFVLILRPVGLFLVYCEMLLVLLCGAVVALLHNILPNKSLFAATFMGTRTSRRRDGTRRAAWEDLYAAIRNFVSMRTPLHVLGGRRMPVNRRRLEKYSRVYRLLRPVLG